MRYLGVDPGRKRIGLAMSDPGGRLSNPYRVVERGGDQQRAAADIAELCRQEEVGEIVVGLPLNMDGSKGAAAQNAHRLAAELRRATGLPVHLWDERLTSVTAERTMIDADLSRAKRKKRIDKVAAHLILQSYLDAKAETD